MQTAGGDSVRHTYDPAQRGFHWVMAIIILAAIGLGIWARLLPPGGGVRSQLLDLHKSLGMTALILVVFRLAWRAMRGEPDYRQPPDPLTHGAAQAAHWGLYALMIFMPVTGYVYSGAGGHALPWFGVFSFPVIVQLDKPTAHLAQSLHFYGAWIIGGVLALHVLAVVWHSWVKRDEVLSRMWPSGAADRA